MKLLPGQRQTLDELIRNSRLNPSDFQLDEGGEYSTIWLRDKSGLGANFRIAIPSPSRFLVRRVPGDQVREEDYKFSYWNQVLGAFESWLGKTYEEISIINRRGDTVTPPSWLESQLPDRYRTLVSEIADKEREAGRLHRMSDLLWQTGDALAEAVCEVFQSVGLTATLTKPGANHDLTVTLAPSKRLLVEVTGIDKPIAKKSNKLTQLFQATQEAGPDDRVILAANVYRERAPAERVGRELVTEDARAIVTANRVLVIPTLPLYEIWQQPDREAAKARLEALYDAEPGVLSTF